MPTCLFCVCNQQGAQWVPLKGRGAMTAMMYSGKIKLVAKGLNCRWCGGYVIVRVSHAGQAKLNIDDRTS